MSRALLAGFLGAIVLFVWGFISWDIIPWHSMVMHRLANEDSVVATLKAGPTADGAYMIPGMPSGKVSDDVEKAIMNKMEQGPIGMLYFTQGGMGSIPVYYLRGFLIFVLGGMLAAMLLEKLSWSLAANYWARVRFVMMLGIFLAIMARIGDWAWLHLPTGFALVLAADDVIGWTLAGMVIAWRIKPLMTKKS